MFEFLLTLLFIYFIWKILKPRILKPPSSGRSDFQPNNPPPSFRIDKTEIEDAEFKEIDEPREKTSH
jgi:hypothetical protein